MIGIARTRDGADEDVGGIDAMGQRSRLAAPGVGERQRDIDGALGEGHVVARFEGAAHTLGLAALQPLVVEGGEVGDIDDGAALGVAHGELAVAFEEHLGETAAAARPEGLAAHVGEVDVSLAGIAA